MDQLKTRLFTILAAGCVLLLAALLFDRLFLQSPGRAGIPSDDSPAAGGTHPTLSPTASPEDLADLALPALPDAPLLGAGGISRAVDLHTTIPNRPRVEVITYTVQAGDNLFKIADGYGLEPETVLWGNYEVLRDNPQLLKPEQVLNILPENGVYYEWAEGDTLEEVAEFFEVEPDAIINYPGNRFDLAQASEGVVTIDPGTWLIVPGGRRELRDWGPPAITRANPAAAAYYGAGYCGQVYEGAIGTGYFIWPTTATFLSGYDYSPPLHNGIDIAGSVGNAIYAADSGVVVFAGWSEFGYGYLVVLDHGTGWQSAYAHLSAVGVSCGQSVGQGTVIGGLGSTGNSTGPHLHFELRNEVYGKVNPWDFVSP
jgi:hypothetical protein